MPKLVDSDHCCGCSACANKCSNHAINMQANEEGFLHPVISFENCVECKACERVCPGLNPVKRKESLPHAYIIQHQDDTIRHQSTSGGAFTAIATVVLNKGGVVFGASMTDDYTVRHQSAHSIEELGKFRNSKYVQSEIGYCYQEALCYLEEGRWVCFSGTPCQINGLYSFLGKDYSNLITVDFSCRAVPSPLVFRKYVEYRKKQHNEARKIVFRDKKRGYSYSTLAWYANEADQTNGNSVYRKSSETDEWLRLFLGGLCNRSSCNECFYQTTQRYSDFTLWDCWDVKSITPELDDNQGTTNVVVWSGKGLRVMDEMKSDVRCCEYPFNQANRAIVRRSSLAPIRHNHQFYVDVKTLDAADFFHKYVPINAKVKSLSLGRYIMWRLHLHNTIRRIRHFFIHRKKK